MGRKLFLWCNFLLFAPLLLFVVFLSPFTLFTASDTSSYIFLSTFLVNSSFFLSLTNFYWVFYYVLPLLIHVSSVPPHLFLSACLLCLHFMCWFLHLQSLNLLILSIYFSSVFIVSLISFLLILPSEILCIFCRIYWFSSMEEFEYYLELYFIAFVHYFLHSCSISVHSFGLFYFLFCFQFFLFRIQSCLFYPYWIHYQTESHFYVSSCEVFSVVRLVFISFSTCLFLLFFFHISRVKIWRVLSLIHRFSIYNIVKPLSRIFLYSVSAFNFSSRE